MWDLYHKQRHLPSSSEIQVNSGDEGNDYDDGDDDGCYNSSYVITVTWAHEGEKYKIRVKYITKDKSRDCLFGWFVKRPRQQLGYIGDGSQDRRLTILRPDTNKTERGDHDFCLSRSRYADTDPTSK